jgi:hypothetical protein
MDQQLGSADNTISICPGHLMGDCEFCILSPRTLCNTKTIAVGHLLGSFQFSGKGDSNLTYSGGVVWIWLRSAIFLPDFRHAGFSKDEVSVAVK